MVRPSRPTCHREREDASSEKPGAASPLKLIFYHSLYHLFDWRTTNIKEKSVLHIPGSPPEGLGVSIHD